MKPMRADVVLAQGLKLILQNNDDFHNVAKAVALNGILLSHASDALRDNKDIAKIALYSNACSVVHVSARLRQDPELMRCALERNPETLEHIAMYQDNAAMVEMAVQYNGVNIAHASERLRDDKGLALMAIANNPFCVRYLSAHLLGDWEVAIASLSHSQSYLACFSDEIQSVYAQGGVEYLKKALLHHNLSLQTVPGVCTPHDVQAKVKI